MFNNSTIFTNAYDALRVHHARVAHRHARVAVQAANEALITQMIEMNAAEEASDRAGIAVLNARACLVDLIAGEFSSFAENDIEYADATGEIMSKLKAARDEAEAATHRMVDEALRTHNLQADLTSAQSDLAWSSDELRFAEKAYGKITADDEFLIAFAPVICALQDFTVRLECGQLNAAAALLDDVRIHASSAVKAIHLVPHVAVKLTHHAVDQIAKSEITARQHMRNLIVDAVGGPDDKLAITHAICEIRRIAIELGQRIAANTRKSCNPATESVLS